MNDFPRQRVGRWAGFDDLPTSDELALARSMVAAFEPTEELQWRHREDVLTFIDEHDDALHRSCLPGHLTGSAWVVDHRAERGLVLHHAKIQRWVQPGGHADGEADLARVALTEATEETGIDGLQVWTVPVDVDIHLFVNRKPGSTEPDHLHLDLRFLVRAPHGAVAVGNHESEALRWVTDDELDDADLSLDDSTVRLARRGFALARSL